MRGLGDLEAQVMAQLWSAEDPRSVREVLDGINAGAPRPLAYTTVMTVLDNLHRKGWLDRELADRAYRYWPTRTREQRSADLMVEALGSGGDRAGTLLDFLNGLSAEELRELSELTELAPERPTRRRRR